MASLSYHPQVGKARPYRCIISFRRAGPKKSHFPLVVNNLRGASILPRLASLKSPNLPSPPQERRAAVPPSGRWGWLDQHERSGVARAGAARDLLQKPTCLSVRVPIGSGNPKSAAACADSTRHPRALETRGHGWRAIFTLPSRPGHGGRTDFAFRAARAALVY